MFFQKKFEQLRTSEFGYNVLTLFSGASVAQIVPLIAAPILARLYAPEQFGELSVIMSIVGIFGIITTFQYESAIMLPKKDEDAFNILALSVSIAIIISMLSWLVIKFFGGFIAVILKTDSIQNWLFIIPAFVFLTGLFNSLNIWASRKKQFKRLAVRQIGQSIVGAGTKVTLGWLQYFSSGLIWGTFAGQFISTGVLAALTIKDSKILFKSVNLNRIKKNAITYKNFPKYTMWHGFFDLVNASGVIFILSSFYGIAVVGLYAFTLGLLQKPTRMIGAAVAQVFYQNASNKVSNSISIHRDTLRLLKNLGLIGGIIFSPFVLAGPYIFSFIFGEKWWDAGVIAQIISPLLFVRFLTSPIANIAIIKGEQKKFMLISMVQNIFFPSLVLVFASLGIKYSIAILIPTFALVLYYMYIIRWVISLIKDEI